MGKGLRTAQYRLYPTPEQERKMLMALEATRQAYNFLLNLCIIFHGFGLMQPSRFNLQSIAARYRNDFDWMQDVHSSCFAAVSDRLYRAYDSFFKRVEKGEKPGYPRFKGRFQFDSFSYVHKGAFSFDWENPNLSRNNGMPRVRLGKIGQVKYGNNYRIKGLMKTATIYRRSVGTHYEWYMNITYECELPESETMCKRPIGIDLGLGNLAALSDGTTYPNPHMLKNYESRLCKLNCKLARSEKGTHANRVCKSHLAHLYKKIRNQHRDYIHVTTNQIISEYGDIMMEDLPVQEMISESFSKTRKKSYRDVAWAYFTRQICYKAAEAGNKVIFVNPAYTSQMCSCCGELVEKDETVRIHRCPRCGLVLDRDVNAACNILSRGLALQAVAGSLNGGCEKLAQKCTFC